MPQFLEKALSASYDRKAPPGVSKEQYIYGAMNNKGYMHGNQETAKGAALDTQHLEDQAKRNLAARKAVGGGSFPS